ncbi:hypothetical protein ACN23B_27070 (plasmid) [Anabaena sp. FACHB-709]|uniref:hypothetical protein n=1 Tax=Nostocaceae TaxID=1162 RepID=UPI00000CEE7A|nr:MULTISPECIES: hypothetical protein [Nostocaceae]RUR76123.1 hypothetical protein DSM107007_47100 [Nostoc sp. PCC 7120 = FACHB-418]BAB78112.1 asl7028 [Nostoc sp. PCC 7120 = FACHB-418]
MCAINIQASDFTHEEITANCELEIANCCDPCDSWWQQVKSYATLAMSRVTHGVDAVKQFLSTLNSDER